MQYALEKAMDMPLYSDTEQVIANAKKWAEDLTEREKEIACQKKKIADKVKEVDKLLKDAQEVSSVPSKFADFVINKVKEKYPNFYANCEKAWQKLQAKKNNVRNRASELPSWMREMDEAYEHRNDEDQMQL